MDYFIVRGLPSDNAEEHIKNLIPEEKLFINKSIFRDKIAKLNFNKLDPAIEKKVLDDLKQESIALSEKEIQLYYNLLKLGHLSGLVDEETVEEMTDDQSSKYLPT